MTHTPITLSFDVEANETEVDIKFVYPLLSSHTHLSILPSQIKPQDKISAAHIGKGKSAKFYKPDFVVHAGGFPVIVCETKRPNVSIETAASDAHLYAAQINAKYKKGLNPIGFVLATNGIELSVFPADSETALFNANIIKLTNGSPDVKRLAKLLGSDAIQQYADGLATSVLPDDWHAGSEFLGQSTVSISKAGHNEVFELISPLLRNFFDPQNSEYEDEIIKKAYVTTEEHTKYQRTFENFLRDRIIPVTDAEGQEIETSKRSSSRFTQKLTKLSRLKAPFMQLIIGGVGSGKSTFIKRYFEYLMPIDLKEKIVFINIDVNSADDNLEHFKKLGLLTIY